MTRYTISGDNPQDAWEKAVSVLLESNGHRVCNLIVHIIDPVDFDWKYSRAIDATLEAAGPNTIRAIARTIMPISVLCAADWEYQAWRLYPKLPPRSYFKRMVDYEGDGGSVNQIKDAIAALSRRTSTGARWADPGPIVLERLGRAAAARVGFPCLSAIQFHRFNESLTCTALYRSHYYAEKAYGNFIGLGRLHKLVAKESGYETGQLTVVSTDARLDRITQMRHLLTSID